jgi:hypothetical protein
MYINRISHDEMQKKWDGIIIDNFKIFKMDFWNTLLPVMMNLMCL